MMQDNSNQQYTQFLQDQVQDLTYFDQNNQKYKEQFRLIYLFIQVPNYAYSYTILDDTDSRRFMYYNYITVLEEINQVNAPVDEKEP